MTRAKKHCNVPATAEKKKQATAVHMDATDAGFKIFLTDVVLCMYCIILYYGNPYITAIFKT